MDSVRVLVVDDESRMRKLIKDFLSREGFRVLEAGDGEEALRLFFSDAKPDLVILDVMMPKLDGWQVLEEIRRFSDVPVIMLTAKAEEQDELRGFSLGVDEYITKPFSPRILVARTTALLRRRGSRTEDKLELSGICLDKAAHEVIIDEERIELSFKEFELLTYFMENKGLALSREAILNHVWNYNYYGDARTIDTHVKKLRSKLKSKGDCIKTVWGVGYKFETESE